MGLALSESRAIQDSMYNEFEDVGKLILNGLYDQVDKTGYMRTVYLVFLDKLLTGFEFTVTVSQHNFSQSMIESANGGSSSGPTKVVYYLIQFFTAHCKQNIE